MAETKNNTQAAKAVKVIETDITQITPDDHNFNKGTQYGDHLMTKSLEQFGLGRSILVDKNNRVIAGNKTLEKAAELGFEHVTVVETDGNTLVAVKRTDVDLDSRQGREMAAADNATSEKNLAWDMEELKEMSVEVEGFEPKDWGIAFWDEKDTGGGYGGGSASYAEAEPSGGAKEGDIDPNALPPELQGVDINPDDLPKIKGDGKTAMERIIIVYPKDREGEVAHLIGKERLDKVVYNINELLSE